MLERFLDWISDMNVFWRVSFLLAVLAAGFILADQARKMGQEHGLKTQEQACKKLGGIYGTREGQNICIVRH